MKLRIFLGRLARHFKALKLELVSNITLKSCSPRRADTVQVSSVGFSSTLKNLKTDKESQSLNYDLNLSDCFGGKLEDTFTHSSKTVKLSPILEISPTLPSYSATGFLIEFTYQLKVTLIFSNKQTESFTVPLHLANKTSSPDLLQSRLESLRSKHSFFCPQEMPGSHFSESNLI